MREVIDDLKVAVILLNALEAAGVDNWSRNGDAWAMYEEEEEV